MPPRRKENVSQESGEPLANQEGTQVQQPEQPVQELYGPALRQIGRLEFHKPYPDYIDVNNLYPMGYRVHDFSLFSEKYGQSSMEHIARFTLQCGELANLENFNNLKLRLFPNSLTGAAFDWYASLPRNSVTSWQEMERQFQIQFYRTEPEVCIADLSRFKKMKNRCKVFLPETEFMKMAQKGMDFELRKKFQDMEFRDFFELAAKKPAEAEKKSSSKLPKDIQYMFDVSKTNEVFDFLVKEKFITFPPDHRMPPKEELKGREYCKYHNSYNHATKSCWAFRNILQDIINKGILKLPDKQESMVVDDKPFPLVASINVNVTDLRDLLNEKRSQYFAVKDRIIKKC
ncbi:uncharacterized protein [Primulina huaijiensis]|uniref:uncharacterized protein n=1 Tax=Primulina huaijiensis TaxID=1492673 RepID=UPI003CC6E1C8